MLDWIPYTWSNVALVATQAALVALPAAGLPPWLRRFAGPWWSLVLPLSIAVVVGVLAVLPELADGLTWLSLVALPLLAAASLGWAARGSRWWLAPLAVPLLVVAVAASGDRVGEIAAGLVTALSCVALGRLLAGAAPTTWLRVALVVMAVIDAVLVFSTAIDQPTTVLNTAAPGYGLPQLQYLSFAGASMGYGDVFVAGVLGGILAAEGASARRQLAAAGAVLVGSLLFDLLFAVPGIDLLPATVPVAVMAVVIRGPRTRTGDASPPAAAVVPVAGGSGGSG